MTPEVQSVISYSAVYGLHSKSMIIDDNITVIGSFNLDPRSANYNTECIVIIRSEKITRAVSRYIEEEFLPENAWHITKDFNPDKEASFSKQVKSASRKPVPKKIL
jgi:putative cardiolipin synthase